jgi:Ca2+-binding EF-hand superfamily protein
MDLNKDGTLSREEFNCAIFSMLDKDGDGLLSREEYEAGFDMFDSDKDGLIFKSEFVSAFPWSSSQDRCVLSLLAIVSFMFNPRSTSASLRFGTN